MRRIARCNFQLAGGEIFHFTGLLGTELKEECFSYISHNDDSTTPFLLFLPAEFSRTCFLVNIAAHCQRKLIYLRTSLTVVSFLSFHEKGMQDTIEFIS